MPKKATRDSTDKIDFKIKTQANAVSWEDTTIDLNESIAHSGLTNTYRNACPQLVRLAEQLAETHIREKTAHVGPAPYVMTDASRQAVWNNGRPKAKMENVLYEVYKKQNTGNSQAKKRVAAAVHSSHLIWGGKHAAYYDSNGNYDALIWIYEVVSLWFAWV